MYKKVRFALIIVVSLAAAVFFLACASAPKEEITATTSALQTAQTDDVRTYAPESLKAAEDAMAKATAEVQVQDGKFALSRDYKQASDLLKQAKDSAAKAVTDAEANKARAKADAETLIASLTPALDEAKKALATAPRGKDTKADLEAMQNDLTSAQEAASAASLDLSQDKYKDALAQAETAKAKATGIIDQVQAAKQKTKARR